MNWFEGTIPAAIAEAKLKKVLFIVFVEGEDEMSSKMCRTFDSSKVTTDLEGAGCVAIKIQAATELCKQFSQIYPVVIVPSTYFIGNNGILLEVIAGEVSPEEFTKKVNSVLEVHVYRQSSNDKSAEAAGPSNKVEASGTSTKNYSASEPRPSSNIVKYASDQIDERAGSSSQAAKEELNAASTSEPNATEDDEQKQRQLIERAKQLIALQREQKAKEEEEEEKRKELERRKVGQDVQKLRQQQQDAEAKRLAEGLAKERAEEKAARDHIRQQIAKDREERAMRYKSEKTEQEQLRQEAQQAALQAQQERGAADAAARSNIARLQFRLPDGSSSTHQFPAEATLADVWKYVEETVQPPFRAFTLSTTFPKREYTVADHHSTLRELQLAPCAAMLVLPVHSTIISASSSASWGFLGYLMAPILAVYSFLRTFLFGSATRSPSHEHSRPQKRPKDDTGGQRGESSGGAPEPHISVKRRTTSNPSTSRQEGNIHRFTNNDDDDENNTWNGNSTQQM